VQQLVPRYAAGRPRARSLATTGHAADIERRRERAASRPPTSGQPACSWLAWHRRIRQQAAACWRDRLLIQLLLVSAEH
jgi:hypothetical protein